MSTIVLDTGDRKSCVTPKIYGRQRALALASYSAQCVRGRACVWKEFNKCCPRKGVGTGGSIAMVTITSLPPQYPATARICQSILHLTVASQCLTTNTPQVERMVPNVCVRFLPVTFQNNQDLCLRSSLGSLLSHLSFPSLHSLYDPPGPSPSTIKLLNL